MHVVGAALCQAEQRSAEHLPVIEGEDEIRCGGRDLREDLRRVGILRRNDRDAVPARMTGDALEPDFLAGLVCVRDDQRNLDAPGQQHAQATDADIVVGEDDGPGQCGSSGRSSMALIR